MIDHYVDFFTNGTGKFFANSVETGISVKEGDMPEIKNMPFICSIMGTPSKNYEKYQMYEMLDESGRKHYSDEEIEDFIKNLSQLERQLFFNAFNF